MSGPLRVELRKISDYQGVISLRGFSGESEGHIFHLPWLDKAEWEAVLLSLELHVEDQQTWPQKPEVIEKAQEFGLFVGNRPSNERFKIIGKKLYDAVFGFEKINSLLIKLMHTQREAPILELHIPEEGSLLQSYPWELLHNGNSFLFNGNNASLVRHVDFEEKASIVALTGILRVLYIAPRPNMQSQGNYANLPAKEKLHLDYLNRLYPDHFVLESLRLNTLDALQKHLMSSRNSIHIVHIDTHGDYGWLCECKSLNNPDRESCFQCGVSQASDWKNQGYLAFENSNKDIEWISGEELGNRLGSRGIQVVVLSACRSGIVGGASTFNSSAGALIKNQIPSVIAMQSSISVKNAEKFVEFFYWALINGMSLTEAMSEVRKALEDSWYRPVLYMRTDPSNYRGKLFSSQTPVVRPDELSNRERWIARLGFRRDPFLYTEGEKDPYLQEYYYTHIKHFHDIASESKLDSIFVFGPSGSGKSSMRNVLSQTYSRKDMFPIVYQDFGPLVLKYQRGEVIEIRDHVVQIIKIALRTLFDLKKELTPSSLEIDESKIIRNQFWLYVSQFEDDLPRKSAYRKLLKPDIEIVDVILDDDRELLGRFCRYVRELFGIKSVYILVDQKEEILALYESLLSTRRIFNLSEDKVSFKFFFSQEYKNQVLQIPWIGQEQSRIVYNLRWTQDQLLNVLKERLLNTSNGRYESLGQLSAEVLNIDERVVQLSMLSPRELIVICDRLFSEHCSNWIMDDEESLLLTPREIDTVLNSFEARLPKSATESLIAQGESEKLEFKSTLRYNLQSGSRDKELESEIARTMCSFMNTEGGTLLIGVKDDKSILGLDKDFSILSGKRGKEDRFEQAFVNITQVLFDTPLLPDQYKARFENIQNKLIYVVEVNKSEKPVFCLFDRKSHFYIRKQTTTQELDAKGVIEYCTTHFK